MIPFCFLFIAFKFSLFKFHSLYVLHLFIVNPFNFLYCFRIYDSVDNHELVF